MASRSIRYKSLSIRSPRFVGVGVGDDNDAAAFLQEAGITDYMQQRAIFELVSRLKGADLWSKMKAIYPFIGGTASTHKWNLKDPRDVDAAFRLTFNGGWTHSSTGAEPNGTNAYADTFLVPNSTLTAHDNFHISFYSRYNGDSGAEIEMGVQHTSGDARRISMLLAYRSSPTVCNTYMIMNENGFRAWADLNARAYYIFNRLISSLTARKNDVIVNTDTASAGTTMATFKLYVGANNEGGTAKNFSKKQTAFVTVGDNLSSTDATNLYTIVDLYQKRLSRAV